MQGSALDVKERIREAVDIVDLVGSYLQLRREGRGYKALCPWHDDSKPSLTINPERQSFKCWVCGDKGGDIFSFVMAIERVAFPEALAMLAERAGVQLDKPRGGGPPTDEKRTLYQAMAWATSQYHRLLQSDPKAAVARQYFAERSITPASIERFQLGYSPVEWDWIVQAARGTSFSPAVLEKADIVGRRPTGGGHYDRFRNRVLFPILDAQGRPIAMGGRVLPGPEAENTAKYLNSRETPLFTKSHHLYALNLARDAIRKTGTALVMEGYTDVVIAHQCGFENAVAVLGTALGAQQIRVLKRFADRLRIVLVLDGDEAGRKRAGEVLQLFVAENVDVRVLTLPEEFDPAEFLLERGAEALAALIDRAPTRSSMPCKPGPRESTWCATRTGPAKRWSRCWTSWPRRRGCATTRRPRGACGKKPFWRGSPASSGWAKKRSACGWPSCGIGPRSGRRGGWRASRLRRR